jgi:hypothetical protein
MAYKRHWTELFADLFDRTNWKLAIAAWHSLTSDVSQQEMLRTVAKQGPSLVITNVQRFPWNRLIVDGIADHSIQAENLSRIIEVSLFKKWNTLKPKFRHKGLVPESLIATFGVKGHSNDEGRHRGFSRFRMESRQGRIR